MIVPTRGKDSTSENTGDRIISTFLNEMDGLLTKKDNIFIVASVFLY